MKSLVDKYVSWAESEQVKKFIKDYFNIIYHKKDNIRCEDKNYIKSIEIDLFIHKMMGLGYPNLWCR